MAKQNPFEKQLRKILSDAMSQKMIREADEKFRQRTEHGTRSLTVFQKIPYQMIDRGDSFYFVEIPGFVSDDTHVFDPNVICNFDALEEENLRWRKKFTIKKSDIVEAEIGGRFIGYFNRLCGYLSISYMKGARLKRLAFYLPGLNNQFELKKFLGDINVTINPSEKLCRGLKGRLLDRGEDTVIGALIKFFNKKSRLINLVNWLLAVASVVLIVLSAVFDFSRANVMMGIAALLPLVIYGNYIRWNGLLGLLLTGIRRKKNDYHKRKPACFGKIIVPTVALLMTEVVQFSELVSFRQYVLLGLGIGLALAAVYDAFVPLLIGREWRRRGMVCGAMCLFYAFMAVLPVNRLWVKQVDSRVIDYPDSYGYEEQSRGETFHYCRVNTNDKATYTFYISPQDYEKLERHELSAQVNQYTGLLQLKYYEFELVEASEGAKGHSAFLDGLPRLPMNPTPEQLLEYQRKKQAIMERLQELAGESNLLVSGTDLE